MHSTSVLYDKRRLATPSEQLFAKQHRSRQERMQRAAKIFGESVVNQPSKPVRRPQETIEQWKSRQLARPLPPIDKTIIEKILAKSHPDVLKGRPSITDVIHIVALRFGISTDDLIGACRRKHVCLPRQIAMYLAYTLCGRYYPYIGSRFGGKDHSTIHHAVRKIKQMRQVNADLNSEIEVVAAALAEIVA